MKTTPVVIWGEPNWFLIRYFSPNKFHSPRLIASHLCSDSQKHFREAYIFFASSLSELIA